MSTDFEDLELDLEEYREVDTFVTESSPAKRLERRRKIEDLFEEKRLKEELLDFA